jgi:FkbM family methyltransferase
VTTLEALLEVPPRYVRVADVGAACLGESPSYQPLIERNLARVFAFDADERQVDQVKSQLGSVATVLPCALGNGKLCTLHVCPKEHGWTSLLEPDESHIEFFHFFSSFSAVAKKMPVKTHRLDDVEAVDGIDYLKMDIQGAELMVLQSGWRKLRDCVAIQLEVSFVTLYKDQPAFGELDIELRRHGFVPHCFAAIKRSAIAPTANGVDPTQPFNQLLEADIVYVRDIFRLGELSTDQLKRLTLVAHYCYRSPDLAGKAVLELQKVGSVPSSSYEKYLEIFNSARAPA